MIKNHVKEICNAKKINITQACNLTGLARSVFGRLYRNETVNLNMETIDSICKGLGVNIDEIFSFVPDEVASKEDKKHVNERKRNVAKYNQMRKRNQALF